MSARGIRVRLVFSCIFTSDVFFAFIVSHLYSHIPLWMWGKASSVIPIKVPKLFAESKDGKRGMMGRERDWFVRGITLD